jgi:hypothetical protein
MIEQVKRDKKRLCHFRLLTPLLMIEKFYTDIKKVKILNFQAEVSILL